LLDFSNFKAACHLRQMGRKILKKLPGLARLHNNLFAFLKPLSETLFHILTPKFGAAGLL
jgi:hypothetical protein